ncbi:MAG TPA: DUF305 domain-containing protein [Acidimicrobiales bacterium]
MRRVAAVLTGVALVVASVAAGVAAGRWWAGDDGPPGEGSVDVGFARDMARHHDQAVELSELVRDRTDDPDIRQLARDIALTQQAQIGEMRGWLDAWGLPPTSVDPPMQWMDHGDPDTPMPGLADDDEIAALTAARGVEAETLFLELMIRHHEGGIHMAEAAAGTAGEEFVRRLAGGMAESQQAEIAYLQDLLDERRGG